MFSYVSPEARVPTKHPLRPIWATVSEALVQMDDKLEKLYSQTGRPSIAPEYFTPSARVTRHAPTLRRHARLLPQFLRHVAALHCALPPTPNP